MKFKLDENLPVLSAAILTSAGHDVDTVIKDGLIVAPDRDVVPAHRRRGTHRPVHYRRLLEGQRARQHRESTGSHRPGQLNISLPSRGIAVDEGR